MKIIPNIFAAITTAIFLSSTSTALAGVTAHDANNILKAMQASGWIATMGTDNYDDPKISSRVADTKFSVYFYGCTDNKNCKSILIKAGYDLKTPMSASKVNEWNRTKRFGRAYIDDEGDPFLEMDVNLDFDGVGDKNFEDTLDWWRVTVESFEAFIDW